jgi:hypothetical protein
VRAVDHDIKPGVESDLGDGHDWSARTGRAMAANLIGVAKAPSHGAMPVPPSS